MADVNSNTDVTPRDTNLEKGKPAWFTQDVTEIPANAQKLLEQYSNIPQDQVLAHVLEQRNKAFEIFPYPCIGQLRFLSLNLSAHPLYPQVLERLGRGQTLLDVGCCFGQDVRKLVVDGAPAENIYGTDVESEFMELGYNLFRDRDTLKSTFFAKDMLDPIAGWENFIGKMDVVFISSFLHLFDWAGQITAARQLTKLLRPKAGSVIVGRQLGSVVSGEFPTLTGQGTNFRHDVASFEKLWKQIGDEHGCRWSIEASLDNPDFLAKNKGNAWSEPNMRMITFTVTRE